MVGSPALIVVGGCGNECDGLEVRPTGERAGNRAKKEDNETGSSQ